MEGKIKFCRNCLKTFDANSKQSNFFNHFCGPKEKTPYAVNRDYDFRYLGLDLGKERYVE